MSRSRAGILLLLGLVAGLGTNGNAANCDLDIRMAAALTIRCPVGSTDQVQYTTSLLPTNCWITLTNLVLPYSPYDYVDLSGGSGPARYYRVIMLGQGPSPDTNPPPRAPIYFNIYHHQEAVGSLLTGFRSATNFATWLTNDLELYDTNGLISDQYFSDFIADVMEVKGLQYVFDRFRNSGQNLGYHFHPSTWDVTIRWDQIKQGEFFAAVAQYPYWETAYYDWHVCEACGAYEYCGDLKHWDDLGGAVHGGIGLMQEKFGKEAVVDSACLDHAPVALAIHAHYPRLRVGTMGSPHAYHNVGLVPYIWKSDFVFSPDPYLYVFKMMGTYYKRTHSQAWISRGSSLTSVEQMLAQLPRDRSHIVAVHVTTPPDQYYDDPLPALLNFLKAFVRNNPDSRFISLGELPDLVCENPRTLTMPDLDAAAMDFLRQWHGRPPAFVRTPSGYSSLVTLFKGLQFALQSYYANGGQWPAQVQVPDGLLPPLGFVENLNDPKDRKIYEPIPVAALKSVITNLLPTSIPYVVDVATQPASDALKINAAELLHGMATLFLNYRSGVLFTNVFVQKGHIVPISNLPNESDNNSSDPREGYATDRLNWYDQLQLWTLEPLEFRRTGGSPSGVSR